MSFEEATAYLDALGIDAMKSMRPSTTRIEAICEALNHPERTVPAIHITGTNGKSSTARIASSLLSATGLKVATFTSPHLESVRERLALDLEPVSEDDFGAVFDHLMPYVGLVEAELGERLTYFEILTAMFFLWASEAADAMVVEVGLGGRWDATNVVPAPVSVITSVALDHTELLGAERTTIAAEKAGIIKAGAEVVTAERAPDVLAVIADEATEKVAAMSVLDRDFTVADNRVAIGGRYLSIATSRQTYEGMFLPLHGAHQGVNAATALEAVTRFLPAQDLSEEVVAAGLARVTAPGRLETIDGVVLDVAHNPDGVSAMVGALVEAFAFDQVVFVVGVLADKDHRGILAELATIPCRMVATRPTFGRALEPATLRDEASELGIDCEVAATVPEALARAEAIKDDALVCVTGSHYAVGEARAVLNKNRSTIRR